MSGLTLSAGIVVYAIVMMMNDDCWLSNSSHMLDGDINSMLFALAVCLLCSSFICVSASREHGACAFLCVCGFVAIRGLSASQL